MKMKYWGRVAKEFAKIVLGIAVFLLVLTSFLFLLIEVSLWFLLLPVLIIILAFAMKNEKEAHGNQ